MNRRSVLRWLGLAPVAAPAAVAAASAEAPASGRFKMKALGSASFTFDPRTGTLTVPRLVIEHPSLPDGQVDRMFSLWER